MATYTVNTNANREAALTAIVGRLNARRAAWNTANPGGPTKASKTNDDYLQKRINEVLSSYVDQEDRRTEATALSASQRTKLGVAIPQDDPNDLGD